MKRGDIMAAVLPSAYGKPRPVLVVQSDMLQGLDSVVVCPLTSHITDIEVRVILRPDVINGLEKLSQVMCDKVSTLPVSKIGHRIGSLDPATMREIEQQLMVVVGVA